MIKKKHVLVIGHRAPDSDAVCSAIGYAYFKNHLDKTRLYVPCRAGTLNEETTFILERFNLETPVRIDSVVATVEDMDIEKPVSVSPEQTMMDIAYLIKNKNIQSFPVDRENRLLGIVDKMDMAVHYVERLEIESLSDTPIKLSALDHKFGDVFYAAILSSCFCIESLARTFFKSSRVKLHSNGSADFSYTA